MKAPGFWYREPGLGAALLSPLSALWAIGARRRAARPCQRVPIPVICVGNLTVGGTGKSPTVMALVEMCRARGVEPHILSRGYGGSVAGPVAVTAQMTADEVGDEPVMLRDFAQVWVARDRLAGAQAAAEEGAQTLILDDGFQDPSLCKDLSILVVDAETGFGNGRLLPAGPLRERVADGVARADLALMIGQGDGPSLPLPTARGRIEPLRTGMPWAGLPVVAFAGIGRPEKVFATLRGLGVDLKAAHGFGDHAPYTPAILSRLEAEARRHGAQLVTTEKDAARLPADFRAKVLPLAVRLHLHDGTALETALDRVLAPS
ncbi:tetraacyldisaccharide 4'-kinase [Roseobacter sp. HKCCA0434]|uniref:tetraacyldisaccharide 4'-kinase n=1 Tax=Roseobacter sp. HKCCA0434 TaxID=3079297 RepID=UPI002905E79C|nr:tetraacyldisaccharide 4'-kinase [Roseobacter sp. HKCCA0434]